MMMVEDVMIGYSRAAVNRRESPNTMFWNDIRQISSLAGHDRARVSEIYRGIDDPAQNWSFWFALFTAELAEGIIA
jgi:hypothetical protein